FWRPLSQEGIGLDAVNDGLLIESSVYQLLKRYCRDQPYYLNLIELFLQSSYQTELGQTLDLFQINLENYGKKDPEKINRVKALYEEQDLKAVYQSYEENSYQKIVALIDQHAVRLPARIFLDLADKIYKRQK
ncbi:PREDICTED: farnesyl pyrophosphate synthase, partial [Thamnophis sirtalis]|uniref:(2E,6E)-farnesyl diphosphate synthase n=1 Tax=Thamnophis sirtalis TaxID=35019 RepID=A0A6I9XQT6_9SAUR